MNKLPNKRVKDLTGLEIGSLKVVEFDHIDEKSKDAMWLCECKCGNRKLIRSRCLTRKNPTKSCGCLQREIARKNVLSLKDINKGKIKGNTYLIEKDMVVGYETAYGHKFFLDLDDFELVSQYTWREGSHGYLMSAKSETEGILLHRLILSCNKGDGIIVDHINRNKMDCRKSNLRIADNYINTWNSAHYGKSGIKGVRFRKGKYEARITYKGQTLYLGRFLTIQEVQDARTKKELDFYPEYRRNEVK